MPGRNGWWCGVGVTGGDLDVPDRHPRVQGSGDEAVPERVRRDVLAHAGLLREADDDAGGSLAVQPLAVAPQQQRAAGPFPGSESTARATRGGSGMTASLEPLPSTVTVRWPR